MEAQDIDRDADALAFYLTAAENAADRGLSDADAHADAVRRTLEWDAQGRPADD